MWESIKRSFLSKAVQANQIATSSNLSSKKILFLIDVTVVADLKSILNYRQELVTKGWDVYTLSYTKELEDEKFEKFLSYHSKQVNFYGKIKSDDINKILNTEFSYMICFVQNYQSHFEYLIRSSQSQMCIGRVIPQLERYFDLTIDSNKPEDTKDYIIQIKKIVDNLNTKL